MRQASAIAIAPYLLTPIPATADIVNPHTVYESRCAACHGPHTQRFVADNIDVNGGDLIWRNTGR